VIFCGQNTFDHRSIPIELGRRISVAQAIRHASDYDEFYLVTKELIKQAMLLDRNSVSLIV